jgi:hypothetical protein
VVDQKGVEMAVKRLQGRPKAGRNPPPPDLLLASPLVYGTGECVGMNIRPHDMYTILGGSDLEVAFHYYYV